ncbi:MAG: YciI family protein [Saprospiraceae bacterium]|nr:YciI family protein [Saprospiraceae bacterium]HMW39748.1 YciI family protein [Saprospiraceae bacterium]HMX89310.1 YciI family protein [Saprospiraceae bacterium]HMZ41194.1 YciI family protein [Saprospiraceae bacterium]HNA64073.1 YciI family protein [Saprospiraceae bacterium]
MLQNTVKAQETATVFDQALADSLGADAYGMRNYYLVMLRTGPAVIEDKSIRDSLFRGHMNNISQLAESGQLVVAGPLAANSLQYRGLFIFKCSSEEEVRALLQADPTIEAKLFDADIIRWYGSAALPCYLPYHRKIEKTRH